MIKSPSIELIKNKSDDQHNTYIIFVTITYLQIY